MYLDGKEVPHNYESMESWTVPVALVAGKEYDFKFETTNSSLGAFRAKLYWKTPSIHAREVVVEVRKKTRSVYLPAGEHNVEFYFSLPYDKMDLCLYGKNHSLPPEQVAEAVGLTKEQVEKVYKDIDSKRRMAKYLHAAPILVPS